MYQHNEGRWATGAQQEVGAHSWTECEPQSRSEECEGDLRLTRHGRRRKFLCEGKAHDGNPGSTSLDFGRPSASKLVPRLPHPLGTGDHRSSGPARDREIHFSRLHRPIRSLHCVRIQDTKTIKRRRPISPGSLASDRWGHSFESLPPRVFYSSLCPLEEPTHYTDDLDFPYSRVGTRRQSHNHDSQIEPWLAYRHEALRFLLHLSIRSF